MKTRTCQAKNPSSCRYHGTVLAMEKAIAANDYSTYESLKKEVDEMEKEGNIDKMEKANSVSSYKVPKIVKIYRAGSMTVPKRHKLQELNDFIDYLDDIRPEGRQKRAGAIFAAPAVDGLSRWVLGNNHKEGTEAHEIRVDPNKVYVYNIEAYENFSWGWHRNEEEKKAAGKKFWDSGMTLKEWLIKNDKEKLKGDEWEILFSEEDVVSTRPMSHKQIVITAPEHRKTSLMFALAPRLAGKGVVWKKREPKAKVEEAA